VKDHEAVGRYLDPGMEALLAGRAAPRRALFLDRDGVINVDRDYVHSPSDTEWVPGVFELVRWAWTAGLLPIVVTNQAGIARGYYDTTGFLAFTAWIHQVFAQAGAPLLATFFCPHHPTAGIGAFRRRCHCRKPAPGMLEAAAAIFQLDMAGSLLVGDKQSDIEAASNAGVGRAILLEDPTRLQDPSRLFALEAR
jgi:D-glycero-D-manno-heptose 1,7-bisphosphate phosphatase